MFSPRRLEIQWRLLEINGDTAETGGGTREFVGFIEFVEFIETRDTMETHGGTVVFVEFIEFVGFVESRDTTEIRWTLEVGGCELAAVG
jgi:hypothetical protein